MADLLTLLPLRSGEMRRVVELGCGEGRLASAIPRAYPSVSVLPLDGSKQMRLPASAGVRSFGARAEVGALDLHGDAWFACPHGVEAVVSSLALHHVDELAKRRMVLAAGRQLSSQGRCSSATWLRRSDGNTGGVRGGWDLAAERQSLVARGSVQALERFR
jgi:trans-aconitate methyltransferase